MTDVQVTRREMLKLGLLGAAVLSLPLERNARASLKTDRIPESRLPKPFQVPFRRPPVLQPVRRDATTDYYRITMRQAQVQILPGFPKTTIYGYNGIAPGPTIVSTVGRPSVVRQINRLPRISSVGEYRYRTTTSVHLHDSASLPQYDGYAEDVTPPGYYKDYRYPNNRAATLWYHDHAIHHTAPNAYMGLAGMYIERDALELSLGLPQGRYDVPLVIRDAMFATDGSLIYDDDSQSGAFGDVILVNGRPWPRMKVERRKYRFRLLNASISRGYRLRLSTGDPMIVIGTDGGLMPQPQEVGSFRFGMAERYEIVIDFSRYRIGQNVDLVNPELKNNRDFDSTNRIMRFEVAEDARTRANNDVPSELRPNNPVMQLQESQSIDTNRFRFERGGGQWTINDRTWDKDRLDARCELDDVEVWELENASGGWFHPIHIHLIDFKVLDRNGRPPFAYERGPKDTVYVGENETVRVLARFGPQTGKYMMHCHNLVHEDHDMMSQFEVGSGGPDPVNAAPARPVSEAQPL